MKVLVAFAASCLAVVMAAPNENPVMEFQKLEAVNPDGSARVFFWSTSHVTFNESVEYCANLGQELLMIKDQIKQEQIHNLIVANGLTQERWLWIQRDDDDFYWGDGEKAVYTNFYWTSTSSRYRGTIVGTAGSNQGKWDMEDSEYTLYRFVCQPIE